MLDKKPHWPADKVARRPIAKLIPAARNARTHSDEQVAQIAASIKEWGWTVPVLCDESGTLIAGHGRVLAARQLGLTEVPVMTATGWSEAKKRAYLIADNKLALNADWDLEALKIEIGDLRDSDFDLGLVGFSDAELSALLAESVGLTDPDEVPEPPVEPVSKVGDVWLLGKHRIVCGDSTDADCVAKALGSVRPHLMVTDPPYGVNYDANWRNQTGPSSLDGTTQRVSTKTVTKPNNSRAIGKVLNDGQSDWREAWALAPSDVAYVWHADRHASSVQASLESVGPEIRCQVIWAKPRFAISRGDYHWQHEPCWYAVRKGKPGHWSGDRSQTTLWEISHNKSETGHSTQKPVECMKRPIENNSSVGHAVYDPFVGSGTTIIAAEMTGRACHAIEISPAYVDIAVARWQNFSGQTATLESTGETFGG
jgi:DNA modification methylase